MADSSTRQLREACVHGRYEIHVVYVEGLRSVELPSCRGGRPVEGEKVWWCETHGDGVREDDADLGWCEVEHIPHGHRCGWKLLIPISPPEGEVER